MTIREGQPKDQPAIVQFQKNMALETEQILLDDDVVTLGVANLFAEPSRGKYYVAEVDGQVIASLMTTYEWSDWRNGTVLWIQSVYVAPAFRGSGVYRQLYQFIQQKVKDDSALKGIRLYVDKSNAAAQAVYAKLGMNGEHYKVFEWMK